jgi:formate hydrogenlyase subunit 3/multisubunit Na+/H+ antiporter MnhD subunit
MSTKIDIIFCLVFSIVGLLVMMYGLDYCLYSEHYAGAGLMLSIGGLLMIAVSGHESLKL